MNGVYTIIGTWGAIRMWRELRAWLRGFPDKPRGLLAGLWRRGRS